MKLLFADEADQNAGGGSKFFVYGAAMFDAGKVKRLTESVTKIRVNAGYEPNDVLKFAAADKPKQVRKEKWIEAKCAVLELARRQNVRFFGYCVHHGITKNQCHADKLKFGANTVISKFQQYLKENNDVGFCFFDRWDNDQHFAFQRAKFLERSSHDNIYLRSENVVGFATICDGSSHLASIADICVGSFRYVVNEPKRDIAGKELARLLRPLFWGISSSDGKFIDDRGLIMRPRNWRLEYKTFAPDYSETKRRLIDWANSDLNRDEE